jgi:hypothetical protein
MRLASGLQGCESARLFLRCYLLHPLACVNLPRLASFATNSYPFGTAGVNITRLLASTLGLIDERGRENRLVVEQSYWHLLQGGLVGDRQVSDKAQGRVMMRRW